MNEEIELDWMPVYWEKLLAGTTHMDAAELGGYILLIAEQWKKGFVPSDIKRLMKIARQRSKDKMNTILEKFISDGNGNLINKVCSEVRIEQTNKYLNARRSGKKGAEKRWQKDSDPIVSAIGNPTFTAITDKKKEEVRDTNVSNNQQYAKEFFEDERELDRENLFLQIRVMPEENDFIKFNAFLFTERKRHKSFEEWLSHYRNWTTTKPKEKSNLNYGNKTRKGHDIEGVSSAADKILREYQNQHDNGSGEQSDSNVGSIEKRA